jgi:hypothetical protein
MHVIALATSRDRLATSLPDGRLRLWSWDGRLVHRSRQAAAAPVLAFGPDGSNLVVAGNDQGLSVLSANGDQLAYAVLAGRPVGAGASGDTVVTVTDAGVVERWSVPTAKESHR